MSAGDSAAAESQRLLLVAKAHTREAAQAAVKAANYATAARTEKQTALLLSSLASVGYTLLEDRHWPGSRRSQVDLVLIGPGGLFIVDTKAWSDVTITGGRIFRGQDDATDELCTLSNLVQDTQDDLAMIGLAPGEVRCIAAMACQHAVDAWVEDIHVVSQRDVVSVISRHGVRLTAAQVQEVVSRAEQLFGPCREPAPIATVIPAPVMPLDPEQVQEALITIDEVHAALLEVVMAKPIEDWMSFLHPQQARLVRRSFPGPSRIRGPAGTGKTVVGLHRAAYLARTRPGRILVTTYVRTLPQVLHSLLGRLAPEVVDRVEFSGVHSFARKILTDRGVEFRLDQKAADDAFAAAWLKVGARSVLGASAQGVRYWREEVDNVLKGRGITSFDTYATLTRTGRRFPLPIGLRREVWRLYEAYDQGLRDRHAIDFADLVLMAEESLRVEPMTDYAAVIVDEAQDLSCAMVRLLHSLVGDIPDGFTLIGDGQQSIYPGGYTLAEAGISVAGRGVVLDVNYRNTAQIVSFAQALVAGDTYVDIEGVAARGDVPSSIARNGPEPTIVDCTGLAEVNLRMVERVREVVRDGATGMGDVAVLCATKSSARSAAAALSRAGLPIIDLEHYDGAPVDAVKIGTVKRAKGLEFKQVLVPDIRRSQTGAPKDDEAEHERWDLRQRELYVAMTRARDGLWVGITP